MPKNYKCPKPECPATEFKPVSVTSFGDDVPMSLCGGRCGGTYPITSFTDGRG